MVKEDTAVEDYINTNDIYPLSVQSVGTIYTPNGAVVGKYIRCSTLAITGVVYTGAQQTLVSNTGFKYDSSILTVPSITTTKVRLTVEGGVAVLLTNSTGGASVKGEVVTPSSSVANAVSKVVKDVPNPIGVFYESGIADGSEAWIVVSGIADVYFVGNTTLGHIARGFLTADGASYVVGQAMSEAVPGAPFSADKHFYEIGHVLEARTGAGLAKVVLHFN